MMEVMDDETLDFIIIMAENNNMYGMKLFINNFFLEKEDRPIPRERPSLAPNKKFHPTTNYCCDK